MKAYPVSRLVELALKECYAPPETLVSFLVDASRILEEAGHRREALLAGLAAAALQAARNVSGADQSLVPPGLSSSAEEIVSHLLETAEDATDYAGRLAGELKRRGDFYIAAQALEELSYEEPPPPTGPVKVTGSPPGVYSIGETRNGSKIVVLVFPSTGVALTNIAGIVVDAGGRVYIEPPGGVSQELSVGPQTAARLIKRLAVLDPDYLAEELEIALVGCIAAGSGRGCRRGS